MVPLNDFFSQLLVSFPYIGIFFLMVINGIFSVPSSQILYLLVGAFVARGDITFLASILVGGVGNAIGNTVLFYITKRYGVTKAKKFLPFDDETLEALQMTFSQRGVWWLFVAKLIPSVKVVVPIVAGLAQVKTTTFIVLMTLASWIWASLFIGIGKFFGESFSFGTYSIVILIITLIVVAVVYKTILRNKKEIRSESRHE